GPGATPPDTGHDRRRAPREGHAGATPRRAGRARGRRHPGRPVRHHARPRRPQRIDVAHALGEGPAKREPHRSARPGSDMTKYLVISSDGHAGPPAPVYRDYLDPDFRQKFDEHQAALDAGRMVNAEFVEEWDEETGDY